jgi:hypothetical protein
MGAAHVSVASGTLRCTFRIVVLMEAEVSSAEVLRPVLDETNAMQFLFYNPTRRK